MRGIARKSSLLLPLVVSALAACGVSVVLAAPETSTVPALRLQAAADGRFEPVPDLALEVVDGSSRSQLDLTALDPAAYRSGLVRVEMVSHDGPGHLTIRTPAAYGGGEDTVVDSAADRDEFVVQIGRVTPLTWTFSEPATHGVALRLSAPRAPSGTTDVLAKHLASPRSRAGAPAAEKSASPEPESNRAAAAPAPGESARASATEPGRVRGQSTASALAASDRVVIDKGHVDMGPRIVNGEWRVQLKDDSVSPIVWRDLADVVLHAREASAIEVPPGEQYAFLGSPGDKVYVLPQVQEPDLVWPGWNTQDPSVLDAVPGSVTWRLTALDGPGQFVLYLTGSFGKNEVIFDTKKPLPQTLDIPRNTHVHGNWAFTKAGVYRLTVEMAGRSKDGASLTDRRILTVAVGDAVNPQTAFTADLPSTGTKVAAAQTRTTTRPSAAGNATANTRASTGRATAMAGTGVNGVGFKVAVGVALVAAGALLRRRTNENRNRS